MSLDGYIDDTTDRRLLLSNAEDFNRVDELRASCDAILIGATTIRRDNPRLLVNSEIRRMERTARGLPEYPTKVAVTSGPFDPTLKFFNTGGQRLVYCPTAVAETIRINLGHRATVVGLGTETTETVDFAAMLEDIAGRGIQRLMVEGGGIIHTQFLTQNLVDELQLAIAPFFVGQAGAPRFVNPGRYPQDTNHRMVVKEARQLGDIVYVRYLVSEQGGQV